jgi:hypothetical protein
MGRRFSTSSTHPRPLPLSRRDSRRLDTSCRISSSSRYLMAPGPPKRVLLRNPAVNSTETGAPVSTHRRFSISRKNSRGGVSCSGEFCYRILVWGVKAASATTSTGTFPVFCFLIGLLFLSFQLPLHLERRAAFVSVRDTQLRRYIHTRHQPCIGKSLFGLPKYQKFCH